MNENIFDKAPIETATSLGTLSIMGIYTIIGLVLVAGLYFGLLRNEKQRSPTMGWILLGTITLTTIGTLIYTHFYPFSNYAWAGLDWIFNIAVITFSGLICLLIITRKFKLAHKGLVIKSSIGLIVSVLTVVGVGYGKHIYYSYQNDETKIRFFINELFSRHEHRRNIATQRLIEKKSISIGVMLQSLAKSRSLAHNKKIEALLEKIGPDLIPELHKIAGNPTHPAYNSAIQLILKFALPESWDILAKALYENHQLSTPIREQILTTLHKIDPKKTLNHVYKQLQGIEASLKSAAAKLLGTYPRSKKSTSLLNKALKDKSSAVCEYAADSLGKLKSKTSTTALLQAIRTRSDCDNALRVLAELRVRNVVPYLKSRYKRAKDKSIKRVMLLNLGKVEDKSALPFLNEVLKSSDEQIRADAQIAIDQINAANVGNKEKVTEKIPNKKLKKNKTNKTQ